MPRERVHSSSRRSRSPTHDRYYNSPTGQGSSEYYRDRDPCDDRRGPYPHRRSEPPGNRGDPPHWRSSYHWRYEPPDHGRHEAHRSTRHDSRRYEGHVHRSSEDISRHDFHRRPITRRPNPNVDDLMNIALGPRQPSEAPLQEPVLSSNPVPVELTVPPPPLPHIVGEIAEKQ